MLFAAAILIFAGKSYFTGENQRQLALRDAELAKLREEIEKKQAPVENTDQKVSQKNVVIASSMLKKGEVIAANKLRFRKVDADVVTDDHFKSITEVVGKVLSQDVKPYEPLLSTMLVEMEFKDFHLPVRMRAISVPTSYILGLAYYHKVGSKVDILSAIKAPDGKFPIIVQNATILAVDKAKPVRAGKNSQPQPVGEQALTFEVPASKIREFVTAAVSGKIQIVSRSRDDNQVVRYQSDKEKDQYVAPPVSLRDIQDTSIGELPEPVIPDIEPAVRKVEMIQANVKSEIEFNN